MSRIESPVPGRSTDDVGPEVRQVAGAPGTGQHRRQVDDPQIPNACFGWFGEARSSSDTPTDRNLGPYGAPWRALAPVRGGAPRVGAGWRSSVAQVAEGEVEVGVGERWRVFSVHSRASATDAPVDLEDAALEDRYSAHDPGTP
jgi:hypothetical protein